jgi:hypothetical protein
MIGEGKGRGFQSLKNCLLSDRDILAFEYFWSATFKLTRANDNRRHEEL